MIIDKIKLLENLLNSDGIEVPSYNDVIFYCPKCKHHKRKLSIHLGQEKDGHWGKFSCWVCGDEFRGRNLLSLIRYLKRNDLIIRYTETVKDAKWSNLLHDDSIIEANIVVTLPNSFIPLSSYLLGMNKHKKYDTLFKNAIKYLTEKRGLSQIDIISNLAGISLDKEHYGYIILPSFDASGNINYFISRSFVGHVHRYKKCNASSKEIIYNEINVDWQRPLLIVEGPFDVMKAKVNATCLLGSTLSRDSLLFQKIIENNTKILLSLDPDETGKKKSIRIASLLTEYGVDVIMVDIDDRYEDIADMPYDEWKQTYKQSITNSKQVDRLELLRRKLKGIV